MSEPDRFSDHRPDRDADPSGADRLPSVPPRPAVAGHLIGRAEGVALRTETRGGTDHGRGASTTVLNFRLTAADGSVAEVELRGLDLRGQVREGDWVEVPATRAASGRIETSTVTNVTTGAQVSTAMSGAQKVFRAVFIAIFVAFLIAFIVVGVLMVKTFNDFGGLGGF